MQSKKAILSNISLILVTASWGLTFPLIKSAVVGVPPLKFVAIRFLLASLFLAPLAFSKRRRSVLGPSWNEWRAGFVLGGVLFLGYALQTSGLKFTTASNAGFITGASVAIVPVIAWVVDRSRLRIASAFGIFCALAGLTLLTLTGPIGINPGDVFVLICAIAFACHIVFVGKYAGRFEPVRITWIQISVCSVLAMIYAAIFEIHSFAELRSGLSGRDVWAALAFCAFVATGIAYWVQNSVQKYSTPVQTALIFTCEPVFSALFGHWISGDILGARQIAGCGLMIAGMLSADVSESAWLYMRSALAIRED